MEGVGARLGRSSTRYGPPTIFTGPVRKWKKRWVHVSPSSSSSNNNNHNHHHSQTATNGSNLLFYKWAPSSLSNGDGNGNCNGVEKTPSKDDAVTEVDDDEPPRRKFKYIPVAMLEEEKNDEAAELVEDDEVQPDDSEPGTAETTTSKSNDFDQKPDMNDLPMEETQTPDDQVERQDLNESTLDLSLA